jgi:thioesterase domain-containing protein
VDVDSLVQMQAAAVQQHAGQGSVVIVGYSSGGWVAQAVTGYLESHGVAPAALVLFDTPAPPDDRWFQSRSGLAILKALARRQEFLGVLDQTRLTAMGGYFRIFTNWSPPVLTTPTLLVQPAEGISEASSEGDWQPFGRSADAATVTVQVQGNHFTMLEEYADVTAQAVHTWLLSLQGKPHRDHLGGDHHHVIDD